MIFFKYILNIYGYVIQNPINLIDPEGLSSIDSSCDDDDECNQAWISCYTACLDTLVPGTSEFYLALNAASYVATDSTVYYRNGIRTATWPRFAGKNGLRESRATSVVLLAGMGWMSGASIGCMLSCSMNQCNY